MKKFKRLACVVLALTCLCLFGCNGGGSSENKKTYRTILSDTSFANGLAVSNLDSRVVGGTHWRYSNTVPGDASPAWSLGQYCDLSTTRFRLNEDGTDAWRYDSDVNDLTLDTLFEEGNGIEGKDGDFFTLTNQSGSKFVAVDPQSGTIKLDVDTSKEYLNEAGQISPRVQGEDWVHLILGQSAGNTYVAACDEIWVNLNFSVDAEIMVAGAYAAQFQWIFAVKDMASPVNDYFWFNITLFDDRYVETGFPGHSMFDGGKADATGKYIYAPSGEQVFGEKLVLGKTYNIRLNIRPLLEQAFNNAKEKGALEESSFENMALNSLNIGWEVTNVSKVGVTLSNLSLEVKD